MTWNAADILADLKSRQETEILRGQTEEILNSGNDYPVLALACFTRLPVAAHLNADWFTLDIQCDGFRCNHVQMTAMLLKALPWGTQNTGNDQDDASNEIMMHLWMEKFAVLQHGLDTGLDYGTTAEDFNAYEEYLNSVGITWTRPNSNALDRLQQAIYPMDATNENLQILLGKASPLSIKELLAEEPTACGARLVVLGQNCD